MVSWRRLSGVAGLAVGAAAAGAGALVAAERIAVGRIRLRPDPAAGEPFGQPRGRPLTVLADDGVALHAEISGAESAPVTVVFCHGYSLNSDVWHYQRAALAGTARIVCWDQRSHGRSGRSAPERVTVDQLGADLRAVLRAAVPARSPVVLVGHSMGAMTVMALADASPELFGTMVAGAVLVSVPASPADLVRWLPPPLRAAARRSAPAILARAANGALAAVIEHGRRTTGDLAFLGVRYLAFGDPKVSPAVVDFLERMIRATPVSVVAEFYLALTGYGRPTPAALGRMPVIVISGDRDRIVDPRCGDEVAAAIPGAQLIRVPGTGHMPILETPGLVNDAIAGLVAAAPGRRPRLRLA
jgi:pimeloyl-ACP methyl ester carboxylesterase